MKRWVPLAISALVLLLPANAAQASGDYGCEPSWKLFSNGAGACNDRGMLAPGNDTRTNLFFLLGGGQQAAAGLAYPKEEYEDYSIGHNFFYWHTLRKAYDPSFTEAGEDGGEFYGSRCISLASGAQAFGDAMKANGKLPAAERDALTAGRQKLVATCKKEAISATAIDAIKSAPGREFLAYIEASDAFYGEKWPAARDGFYKLRSASDPWVAETALYMLARVTLNAAQAGSFDEYGDFAGAAKTDQSAVAKARAGFEAYLQRYGQGRYAASARGLLRRTLWLGGDVNGLVREYERLLGASPLTDQSTGDLIEEIDNKLLMDADSRKAINGPLLLATIDLMLMRDAEDSDTPPITAEALAAQEPRFAGQADLFSFVTASHAFYIGKDMRRVLQLIPDDAKRPSYSPLAFSRQVLRGMALTTLKDRNEAGFWRELLGGAKGLYQRPLVELALAMNYERSGKLGDVFAAGSPIGESALREILLHYIAGPEILRTQARNTARPQHERSLALFTLLHKQLVTGDYRGFLTDSALVGAGANTDGGLYDLQAQQDIPIGLFREGKWSDGYACPALATTVATLARNPREVKARLCLGEFYRLNGFDDFYAYEAPPEADELGGTASLFPGKPVQRGGIYGEVIADPKAAAPDKAYALYRAVNCYAPGGGNSCGGKDVEESQRKAWFQQLKRDYPKSEWAQKLKYYW